MKFRITALVLTALLVLGTCGCQGKAARYHTEGLSAYQDGDAAAAESLFAQSLAEKTDPDVLLDLGTLQLQTEQYEKAQESFTKALSLRPRSGAGWRGLGIAQMYRQDWDACITSFSQAIDNPEELDAEQIAQLRYLRGAAFLMTDQDAAAKADFDELAAAGALSLAAEGARLLGDRLLAQKQYEEALETYREGLSRAGDQPTRALCLGEAVCLEYLGQFEEALEKFTALAEAFGTDEATDKEIRFLKTRVQP